MSDVNASFASFVPPLTHMASPIQLPLYNVGDGGGDGTGSPATGGDTPAPAPAAATPAAPAPAGTPQASPTPATDGAPGAGWVPSYRIRETREAALRESQSQWAQREQAYQEQLNRVQSQLHALVGVQPSNRNPETDAIRQQFSQLFPGLAKMEERAADLERVLARAGDLETQTEHYWQSYGRQSMDRLFSHAQETLGSALTDEGKRALHASFVGFVQSSPELTERYANDPTLVEDFWKAFSSTFIDPARRSATVSAVARAPQGIPQDAPSGAPRATPAPKPADMDERVGQAWLQYQQTARNQ